jgi:hypothetical protein
MSCENAEKVAVVSAGYVALLDVGSGLNMGSMACSGAMDATALREGRGG